MFLIHDMEKIEACGPLQWNLPHDQPMSLRIHARFVQDGKTVTGHSQPKRFSPPAVEWMFFMETDGKLKPGQAFAHGKAVDTNGNVVDEWDSLVRIEVELTRSFVQTIVAREDTDELLVDGQAPPAEDWEDLKARDWPLDETPALV
jgi:hypothetical protein